MNESPPKRKAPRLAEHQTEGDQNQLSKETIPLSAVRVNGVAQAPAGYGFENDQLVPVEMPPCEAVPLSEQLEYARLILGLSSWVHEPKLSLRWAAAFVALGTLRQTPKELAASFAVTPHRVRQLIAEAKKILLELQRKVRP